MTKFEKELIIVLEAYYNERACEESRALNRAVLNKKLKKIDSDCIQCIKTLFLELVGEDERPDWQGNDYDTMSASNYNRAKQEISAKIKGGV